MTTIYILSTKPTLKSGKPGGAQIYKKAFLSVQVAMEAALDAARERPGETNIISLGWEKLKGDQYRSIAGRWEYRIAPSELDVPPGYALHLVPPGKTLAEVTWP